MKLQNKIQQIQESHQLSKTDRKVVNYKDNIIKM